MLTGLSASARLVLTTALYDALGDGSDGGIIHLFQNDYRPGPLATVAEFVECDFVGYGPFANLTAWLYYLVPENNDWLVITNEVVIFSAGALLAPQPAYGWYVTDHTGAVLRGWGRFDTPVVFSLENQGLPLLVQLFIPLNTGQSY